MNLQNLAELQQDLISKLGQFEEVVPEKSANHPYLLPALAETLRSTTALLPEAANVPEENRDAVLVVLTSIHLAIQARLEHPVSQAVVAMIALDSALVPMLAPPTGTPPESLPE